MKTNINLIILIVLFSISCKSSNKTDLTTGVYEGDGLLTIYENDNRVSGTIKLKYEPANFSCVVFINGVKEKKDKYNIQIRSTTYPNRVVSGTMVKSLNSIIVRSEERIQPCDRYFLFDMGLEFDKELNKSAHQCAMIGKEEVNLYSNSNTESKTLNKLYAGDLVIINSIGDKWANISIEGSPSDFWIITDNLLH